MKKIEKLPKLFYPEPNDISQCVAVVAGESITLIGTDKRFSPGFNKAVETPYKTTFEIGDMAEYDSYNLSYIGTIVSITEKGVTIRHRGEGSKTSRLKLAQFNWRNKHFDLDERRKRNSEWVD